MMKNPSQDRGSAPVIVDYYAAKVIRPGDTWQIFLRAVDPYGDMSDIAVVLWQARVGTYPTEVTRLKGDDRKEFSGYLFLSTPNDSNLDDFVRSRQTARHSKKLQMQGARILRNEAYIEVRCNDER